MNGTFYFFDGGNVIIWFFLVIVFLNVRIGGFFFLICLGYLRLFLKFLVVVFGVFLKENLRNIFIKRILMIV